MANPIFSNNTPNIKGMINDPKLQAILKLYNGNAKEAFFSLCKQKGIDPQSILNQLR